MLNAKTAVDATNTSLNSQGSAFREQEKYSESLEARINRLQNAWTGLASTAGDTIIYDTIVVVTEGLKALTTTGDSAIGKLGALAPIFGTAATALVFFSAKIRGMVVAQYTAVTAAAAQSGATGGLAVAMGLATTASGALRVALSNLLIASGVGLAFVALGFALEKLIGIISANAQEQEKFEQYVNKNSDAITTNKQAVDELINKYNSLRSAKENGNPWSTEKEEEYLRVQQQLGDFFPALIESIDSTGQAHLKNAEDIQKEIDVLNKLTEAQNKITLETAQKEFGKLVSTLEGGRFDSFQNFVNGSLKSQIEGSKKLIALLYEQGDNDLAAKEEYRLLQLQQQYQQASEKIKAYIYEVAEASNKLDVSDSVAKNINAFVNSLDTSNLDETKLTKFAQELGKVQDKFQEAVNQEDVGLYDKAQESLNNLAKEYKLLDGDLKKSKVSAEDFFESVGKGSIVFVDGEESADGMSGAVGELALKTYELKTAYEQIAGASEQQVEDTQDLIFQFNSLTAQMQGYTEEEIRNLATKQSLTSEEQTLISVLSQRDAVMQSLLAIYPNLLDADGKAILSSQQKVQAIEQENKANDVLIRAYKLARDGKLSAEQEMTVAQAKGTKARIDNIKIEIQALNVLQKQLQEYYNQQIKSMAEEDPNDPNYGRRAYRASQVLGQTQNKVSNYSSELDSLQKQLNSNIGKIDSFSKSIEGSSKATTKDTKAKKDNNKELEKSIYLADKYKQALEALELQIAQQESLRENLPTFSDEYINSLKTQIGLENQKLKLQQDQTKEIEKQVKNGAIQQTGIVKQTEEVKTLVKQLSGYSGTITSKFGERADKHRGTDIAGKKGTAVDAFVGGKVVAAGYAGKAGAEKLDSSYGNVVVVQTDDGTKRLYAHLEKVLVKVGDQIETGTKIGTIGSTGRSTGSHLHYEKTQNGKLVDSYDEVMQARKGVVTSSSKETADVQQAIDNAQSSLISLQTEVLNQQNNILSLEKELIDATRSRAERARTELDAQYANEESRLDNLNIKSEEYAKILENQTSILQRKQQANQEELDYINSLIAGGNLSANTLVELKDRTVALTTEMNNLNQEIQDSELRKYDLFAELRETPEKKIEALRASIELLDEGSSEYSTSLESVLKLLNDIQDVNKKEILSLIDDINSGNFTGKKLEELRDRYEELSVAIKNTNKDIRDTFYEASDLKFSIDDKAIDKSQKKLDTLSYQLGFLNDDEVGLKVKVYTEIQTGIEEAIAEIDKGISSAFAQRELAIAKGFSTTKYDDRIEDLIQQRRRQLSELQGVYNQIQSYLKDAESAVQQAISNGKSAVESAESKAYSDASDAMNKAIKASEDRIATFSDALKRLDNQLGLLQESQFDAKVGVTTQQIAEARNKASQIIAEYDRVASIPVYNEEQKSQVESTLKSLKDELASTNLQIIEYVKNLESTHFESLIYGARESSKEIDRLTGKLNKNLELLEGGLLSGTNLDLSLQTFSGKALDLKSLISDPLAERRAQIQIQNIRSSAYGQQIADAEAQAQREIAIAQEKYEALKLEAEKFHKVLVEQQLKFEENIKKLLEASSKDKDKIKKKEGENLNKTSQDANKLELDNLRKHYENIKSIMSNLGIDIKNEYASIWSDILKDLENNIKKIESTVSDTKTTSKLPPLNAIQLVKDKLDKKKSVPAYAKGTGGALGGLSLVGEKGRELVIEPNGSAYLTGDSNELRNLKKGTQIYSAEETKQLLTDKKTPISSYANGTGNFQILLKMLEQVDKSTAEYESIIKSLSSVALELLNDQNDFSLVDEFRKLFSESDSIINTFTNNTLGKYFNNSNSSSAYDSEKRIVQDAQITTSNMNEAFYLINNIINGVTTLDDNIKGSLIQKLTNASNFFGTELTDIYGNIIPNTNDIDTIIKNVTDSKNKLLSSLPTPKSNSEVLLYKNGLPYGWYPADAAEFIAGSNEGFTIGADKASNYYKDISSTVGNPELGGSSSSGLGNISYSNKPVTYSDEFSKKYDIYGTNPEGNKYQRDRNKKEQEIEKLQAQLDSLESDPVLNGDRISYLTDVILKKQQDLNLADSSFIIESLTDLAKQRAKIAKETRDNLAKELQTGLANGTLTEDAIAKYKDEITNQDNIIADSQLEQKNLYRQQFELNQANRDKQLKPFADKIDDLQHELNLLDEENSADRLRINGEISKEYTKQLDALKSQKSELQKLLLTQKVGSYEWNLTNQAIDDINEKIEDTAEALKNSNKELQSNTNSIIDAMRRAIEKQRDLTIASLRKQLDELDKLYNDKLNAIGDRESQRTYNNELLDREKEIAEIEKQLNILALDNSQAGIAKRLDLEEMLTDKREELAEFQYQRSVELEKKAIEDINKNHKESIETQINDEEYKFNEILNDERYWASIREEIVNGSTDNIKNKLTEFLTYFKTINEDVAKGLGQSFQNVLNIIDELNGAYNSVSQLDKVLTNNKTSTPNNQTRPQNPNTTIKPVDNKKLYTVEDFKSLSSTDKKNAVKDSNSYLSYNGKELSLSDIASLSNEELNSRYGLANGLSMNSTGVLSSIDLTKNLMNSMPKFNLPSLPQLSANAGDNYNLTLKIDNLNGTQKEADNIATTVIKSLQRWGRG